MRATTIFLHTQNKNECKEWKKGVDAVEKKSYIEREICSVYGLTPPELEHLAQAKREGRLAILEKPQQERMTRKRLSQLFHLNREIEQETKRLKELEKGLPWGKGADLTTAGRIEECKTIIAAKRAAAVEEYNRLCRFVDGIEDSLMRQIISLRYINGYNWMQVAMHIGGGNTPDGVRKAHDRFIKRKK